MGERVLNSTNVKNKKAKMFLIPILFVLVIVAAAYGAYYFTSYKNNSDYINSLVTEKQKIDESNSKVAKAFENFEQIDIKNSEEINKIIKLLSNSESISQEALTKIKTISPMAKYSAQFNDYKLGIETNRKIFTQTRLILENPVHADIDKAVEALNKYVTDTSQYYEQSKLNKASIVLPSEILALPDKITQYVSIQKTDYETKSRIYEQYSKYFKDVDKVIITFNGVKTDLMVTIDQIRNNRTTLEYVYLTIEKKLMSLNDIKKSLDRISVPSKSVENHNQLSNVVKGYTDYCEEFKSNLIEFEEAGINNQKLINVNQIFSALQKQYKNLDSSYDNFTEKYKQDKTSYGDISNI